MSQKICVCIALRNGELFIQEQLISILSQVPMDARIIVSDDNSSDRSVQRIIELNDDRIQIIRGPNKGVVKNFEHLLNLVNEDLIFLADQDDVWTPGRLSLMLNKLMEVDLVCINGHICNADLSLTGHSLRSWRNSQTGFFKNLMRNSYIGCTMGFRSKLLHKVLPIPSNVTMHDQWIGLLAELNGQTEFIDEIGILYRRHGKNITSLQSSASLMAKIMSRSIMLILIIKRSYFSIGKDIG